MAPVVSNAGPLIALAGVEQLELLRRLFNSVLIAPAVRAELLDEAALTAVNAALGQGWITEQRPNDTGAIRLLNETLGLGESETITLAQQTAPAWVILDDLAARHLAQALGLPVIGTLGILLQAKEAGHITAIKPLLEQLRAQGLYLSEALYTAMLASAGEAD